jgi:N-acetylmuramoyl-L-alanine amidase
MTLLPLLIMSTSAPVICIDPGHPSEVGLGTKGKKFTENEVNWKVAGLLRAALEEDGYTVVLTKKSLNEKVLNQRRAEIANGAKAALMVRLHCDATGGSGSAIYYPDKTGRKGKKVGPSAWVRSESKRRATLFYEAYSGDLQGILKTRGLLTDRDTHVGKQQGALTGSIYSHVPVLLVEMVVLTNDQDESFLEEDGFDRLTQALKAGVNAAVPLN